MLANLWECCRLGLERWEPGCGYADTQVRKHKAIHICPECGEGKLRQANCQVVVVQSSLEYETTITESSSGLVPSGSGSLDHVAAVSETAEALSGLIQPQSGN